MTLKEKLLELRALSEKAHREVCDLASGKRKWEMCVPPQPTDSDMVLDAAAQAIIPLADLVEELVKGLEKIKANKGMCQMGPPSEICDEIISKDVDLADLVHRGYELGSHNAFADCVTEAQEVLTRAEAHFAEMGGSDG